MTDERGGEDGQRWQVFEATLVEACAAIGVAVGEVQRGLMVAHYARMIEANRQFNLTRITEPAEAAVKHYADSLTLLASPWVDASQSIRVLDVGTGAGLPAVPLAIMCPTWEIKAIDGTGKKMGFVAEAVEALGLGNVHTEHVRAERLPRGKTNRYDLILLRAVGRMGPAIKLVAGLCRPGGRVVFYKTTHMPDEELGEAAKVCDSAKLGEPEMFDITLLAGDQKIERRLVSFTVHA